MLSGIILVTVRVKRWRCIWINCSNLCYDVAYKTSCHSLCLFSYGIISPIHSVTLVWNHVSGAVLLTNNLMVILYTNVNRDILSWKVSLKTETTQTPTPRCHQIFIYLNSTREFRLRVQFCFRKSEYCIPTLLHDCFKCRLILNSPLWNSCWIKFHKEWSLI